MSTQTHLERAESLLARWCDSKTNPRPNQIDIELDASEVIPVVATLVDGQWGYLIAITGLDPGIDTGELWVLYHFAEGAAIVTLRVVISRDQPRIPTIRHLIALAGIYEQELSEVLGVTIDGTPKGSRLFLADDWPEALYPLRKDFQPAGN